MEIQPSLSMKYSVSLMAVDSEGKATGSVYCDSGEGSLPEYILLEGFSKSNVIDLVPYWAHMRAKKLTDFQTNVSVLETIIKFGNTHQIHDTYRLVLSIRTC